MPRGRADIPLASCKRLVKAGAPSGAGRMGEDATAVAHQQLDLLVDKLGAHSAKQCKLMKRKTVSLDVLRSVVEEHASCKGIKDSDFSHSVRAGKGQRGLPQAGIVRRFKAAAGGLNVSEEAKEGLVGVSEAYLKMLAHRAGSIALAAKRQTIQAADVKLAASM